MALLGFSQTEYEYYVDQYRESMKLIGQDAWLYEVAVERKDLYRDPDLLYKKPRKISLVFEENPKPILKRNNWLTEDEELPYIAYVVAVDDEGKPVEVRQYMKIRVVSKYGLRTDRFFIVSRVTGNHIDPLMWICKLVPYREQLDLDPSTEKLEVVEDLDNTETSFGYLKI